MAGGEEKKWQPSLDGTNPKGVKHFNEIRLGLLMKIKVNLLYQFLPTLSFTLKFVLVIELDK